jgi:hypothetical protein
MGTGPFATAGRRPSSGLPQDFDGLVTTHRPLPRIQGILPRPLGNHTLLRCLVPWAPASPGLDLTLTPCPLPRNVGTHRDYPL